MTLKSRLLQIEAASNVRDDFQPITVICRIIVDLKQRPYDSLHGLLRRYRRQ